ncbi:hypothetical protein D3C87_1631340 [compost metagenome]
MGIRDDHGTRQYLSNNVNAASQQAVGNKNMAVAVLAAQLPDLAAHIYIHMAHVGAVAPFI